MAAVAVENEDELPMGITVVTSGAHDSEAFLTYIEPEGENPDDWLHVDLRKVLKKNPATSVPHKVDALAGERPGQADRHRASWLCWLDLLAH